MKKCSNPNCLAKNPISANYCHMCGHKLQRNVAIVFIENYGQEIFCGIGGLGMVLVILGSFGIATTVNVLLGLCMMGAAILFLEKND